MADKVKYEELLNPHVVAVRHSWNPFKDEEVKRLTHYLDKFALVDDGSFLFIYGE